MGAPEGELYDWVQRGTALLESGDSGAAVELLTWALREEPGAASIRESLARALFDSRRFEEAAAEFERLTEIAPDDDYAKFGFGLALWRLRQFPRARDQLAMAAAMRPDRAEYSRALAQVRATLAAREEAGLPPVGQPGEGLA